MKEVSGLEGRSCLEFVRGVKMLREGLGYEKEGE